VVFHFTNFLPQFLSFFGRQDTTSKGVHMIAFGTFLATAAVLAASLLWGGAAHAQQSQNVTWCLNENGKFSPDVQIKGCTAIIQAGKESKHNLAVAYDERGSAYREKGDLDRGIADHSKAIELDPKSPAFYFNRGYAYLLKGNYDGAIADQTMALQLKLHKNNEPFSYRHRGYAYYSKGDYERAIADFDKAISLNPKVDQFFEFRGDAYRAKGNLDRAIADYSEAIRLDPKEAGWYRTRGLAYRDKGDVDRAFADLNEAIRLDPKSAGHYFNRGITNLYTGSLPKALADLNQASELDRKDHYSALWLDIIEKRSKLPGRLAQSVAQMDMTEWPAPLIRLFLGQLTPEAVLAAADDRDPKIKKERVCEANFFSGEFALAKGAKEEAARLFRLAADGCPHYFIIERYAANAELKALGAR
jgi:lipoprotein NlpI